MNKEFGNVVLTYWGSIDILEQLGISLSRQARLRCEGRLSYHKLNSFVFYDADVISQIISDGKVY